MANNLHIQRKLRNEIETQIGERMPVHGDREKCDYLNAFIHEVLRYRNIIPMGIFHSMVSDGEIGGHKIAKDCIVFVHQGAILNDPNHWTKPDEFMPERFLDSNGKISDDKNPAFIPFGIGRRICPGEKLALADLFLIIVRILQQTVGHLFVLPNGEKSGNLLPKANDIPLFLVPNDYQVMLKKV
jgi:cytochrome P450